MHDLDRKLERVLEEVASSVRCIKDFSVMMGPICSKFQVRQIQEDDKELQRKRKANNALFKSVDLTKRKMMEKERNKAKGATTTGKKRAKLVRALIPYFFPRTTQMFCATHHSNVPFSSG